MRRMGLDLGDKTIGVAVSDELGWTAQGVETIARRGIESDMRRLSQLIAEYGVQEIVLGFPKNMNGTIGPRGELTLDFAKQLEESLGLPVAMWDERLSTAAAQRTLLEADVSRKKRKAVIDKMAAAIILQGYMDLKTNKG